MIKLINNIKLNNFFFEGNETDLFQEFPKGQFSIIQEDSQYFYLIRDQFGLNKLFYYVNGDNIIVSNYFFEIALTVPNPMKIYSVPTRAYVKIHKNTLKINTVYYSNNKINPLNKSLFSLDAFVAKTINILDNTFTVLKDKIDSQVFVCLSGGLDSTIIASFASKYLCNAICVTFSYAKGKTIKEYGVLVKNPPKGILDDTSLSEDFRSAYKIAKRLRLSFYAILQKKELKGSILTEVLKYGQDYRDFNVHCAWVNNIIGKIIRQALPNQKICILTGDLMNELVADYTPFYYKGKCFYPQPKISKINLRRFYLYGLDSGDREIGIFGQYNILTIQPYAQLINHFKTLPSEILGKKNCKQIVNGPLLDTSIFDLVIKKKLRAQVGGKDGGTLGLFYDNKITQRKLEKIFINIFNVTNYKLLNIIQAGRYKTKQ